LTSLIKRYDVRVKVPWHVVEARRERLAQLLAQHRYLPVKELCRRLGVSEATARRDLAALVEEKKVTRTFGGALAEFNERFPSFRERQGHASRGKGKIAKVARSFIEPNRTYFFDSGTTIFALAEAFRDSPVTPITVVTSNLPVGEMLAAIPGVRIFQLAGELLHRQSTLVGQAAQRSIEFWNFDVAFLSAEAMNAEGIWNSQAVIIEQQRVVLRRSTRSLFCIDGSKLNRIAPHFLVPWKQVELLLTDVPYEKLIKAGIDLVEDRYLGVAGRQAEPKAATPEESRPAAEGGGEVPVHIL
jgi:DeoR/GlpR family transcriptional regulator of sugar metabolism